jgi:hypothetical protein
MYLSIRNLGFPLPPLRCSGYSEFGVPFRPNNKPGRRFSAFAIWGSQAFAIWGSLFRGIRNLGFPFQGGIRNLGFPFQGGIRNLGFP